jgi:hypothetical protein
MVEDDGGVTFFDAGRLGDSPPQNVTLGAKTPKSGALRVADHRRRKRAQTEAMLWSRPDWRLYVDARTLPQKAGCLPGDLRRAVVKEIVDNGLDNGGGATIEAWNYLEAFKYRGYVIRDNGPGIDPKKIAQLFCVNRDLVSSKLRRAPLRGMLGNGLRVVMGAIAASNGVLIVETRGRRLTLSVDPFTGRTCIDKDEVVRRNPGTAVYIALGDPIAFDGTEIKLAERIIICGRHGVQGAIKSSPHWYSARDLHDLCARVERAAATVGDVVQNLGFELDDGRPARSITLEDAKTVLASLQSTVKATSPLDLGYMGAAAFAAAPGYRREIGHRVGASPYVIEVWAAARRVPDDRRGHGSVVVDTLINRTVCLDGVAGACSSGSISVFGCGLERYSTSEKAPTAHYTIAIGLFSPLIELASDGKRPDLAPFRRQIAIAVGKAARKAFAALDKPERSMSIIDAASEVMVAAYMKASDNGKLPCPARMVMYAARPAMIQLTGRTDLKDEYFTQTLLPDYINAHPDECKDWEITFDARGHFEEPHTFTSFGIGTVEVRGYLGVRDPELGPVVSVAAGSLFPTNGPENRYDNILETAATSPLAPVLTKGRTPPQSKDQQCQRSTFDRVLKASRWPPRRRRRFPASFSIKASPAPVNNRL